MRTALKTDAAAKAAISTTWFHLKGQSTNRTSIQSAHANVVAAATVPAASRCKAIRKFRPDLVAGFRLPSIGMALKGMMVLTIIEMITAVAIPNPMAM
ncbi:hypothetical protein [Rhodopirellula europaea]|uniref:hypothetical protein n=1 Tax=Rhodopirellula europaea TaxID=1263866 RepID=UPI003D299C1C